MKKLTYILFICLCLTACKRCKNNRQTTASGLIVDAVTGNTIANAKVFLGKLESGTYGISAITVDETTSDAYGRYSFEFEAEKNKDYAIIAKADKYFETESVSDFQLEEGKKNESFNIALKPKAVIKIHVKKTDMSYDSLVFACDLNSNGTSNGVSGKNLDTNLLYQNLIAGQYIYIHTYIKKITAQTSLPYTRDSIYTYLIPIDTTYINLNY